MKGHRVAFIGHQAARPAQAPTALRAMGACAAVGRSELSEMHATNMKGLSQLEKVVSRKWSVVATQAMISMLILIGLVGCGNANVVNATPLAVVSPTVESPRASAIHAGEIVPPPATLEINGITQTSAIGTYCWSEVGKGGVCADMIGIPTPKEALMTSSPITAYLRLPITTAPANLYLNVIRVSDKDEMTADARGYRWWNFQEGKSSELPLQSQQAIRLDLDPGLYVLSVSVWWDKKGDVMYGFLLDVQ